MPPAPDAVAQPAESLDVLDTLAKSWLTLQCQMIPSVQRGLVVVGSGSIESMRPVACWPEQAEVSTELTAAARLALEQASPVVHGGTQGGPEARQARHGIACPLLVDGTLFGVVAVEATGAVEQQRAVMQLLQWGANWLEFLVQRESATVSRRLVHLVEVLAAGLEQRGFEAAAGSVATELARILCCTRVSVGFLKGGRVRLRALSHSARFERDTSLARRIEGCMDEALDQQQVVLFPVPADSTPRVTRCHASLAEADADATASVCTVPFGDDLGLFGAITLERQGGQGFDAPTVELCEAVASLCGPMLEAKRREERWLATKVADAAFTGLRSLLGAGHFKRKLAALGLAALAAFLGLVDGNHSVAAPAGVESSLRRVVVAPQAGYLAEAPARAGDVVERGQLLARLDTSDLELERRKLESEVKQLREERRQAFASGDRARVRILEARESQVGARIALSTAQLARSRMAAPFDGVVVSGDLAQSLGAAIERGQELFAVAPLAAQRLVLEVDEADVAEVAAGQRGEVRLSALADQPLPLLVERITPVSTPGGGRNFFRVEARLEGDTEVLRPGMQGVARIQVGERRLVWIWTHDLVRWLRLALWRWHP